MTGLPNEQRPLSGAPSAGLDQSLELGNEDTRQANLLAAPTLGAYRRQHRHTCMCEEARVAFAVELVQEARRQVLVDRLEGIHRYLVVGGPVDHAIERLIKLVPTGRAVLKAAA